MMRTLTTAMSLTAITACGAIEEENQITESGQGEETGSDGGEPEASACTSAADCADGSACDVGAQRCVTGVLAMASGEFVVDGSVWWAASSAPTLRGTFHGPPGAFVQARLGGHGTPATLNGGSWVITLPAGSIGTSPQTIRIWMTDPSGGHVELAQDFALDASPPAITLAPSKVRDESGDAVDFASGEPIHTHGGAEVDLAAGNCPTVYKYAYLMGAAPTFGGEVAPNPLAWKFTIKDTRLDPAGAMYRVRDAANRVLLDWTPLGPAQGHYTVTLRRDGASGIPELGAVAGQLFLEVRARDWAGLERIESWCWNHQPLAAPLGVEAVVPAMGPNDMFGMSFAANSPISRLVVTSNETIALTQRVIQYSAEPTRISLATSAPTGRYATTVVDGFVPFETRTVSCDSCETTPPAAPVTRTSSGPLGFISLMPYLIDEETGLLVFGTGDGITIPPRAAQEPPRAYRIIVRIGGLANLRTSPNATMGEHWLGSWNYTGEAPGLAEAVCAPGTARCSRVSCTCTATVYREIAALDAARIELDPVRIELQTSPAVAVPFAPVMHVPATSFRSASLTWDAGDEDLPGPL